ncbi:isoprenyl transferase [Candidatus Sumerlaeota bacterium]|nr:isoprenyl transferase [Candidatus Sumerlaeota bacterium]
MPSNKKTQRPKKTSPVPKSESEIDPERLPRHVAIIMDGNGRWAKLHGYRSRIQGHRAGIKSVEAVVEASAELGIKVLSLYAFSKENWLRPRHEVNMLMRLLAQYMEKEVKRLNKNDIKLVVSGDIDDLPLFVREKVERVIQATVKNQRMTLNLCLSYGSRDEIVRATRLLCQQVLEGRLTPEKITKEVFAQMLYHPELGDPDLLIRTSGEMRVSNFLLWQIAYTEIYITPVLWPDFRREHLVEAILDYQRRERRFGRVIEE